MANLTPERLATQLDPLPSLPENVHIYHCDHLGTPLALLDRRGKIGWQVTRDPWGNIARENNLEHLEQPIGMQGQHYDAESGLYYNRHRYYDPWQGKYISQDPIGLMGGTNFYGYPGNPMSFIDPLGLFGQWLSQPGFQSKLSEAMSSQAAINQPWYMNAGTYKILSQTNADMKRLGLLEGDQFFHCMAFCRVSKSKGANETFASALGILKEARDFSLNMFGGLYGAGKLSTEEMLKDNLADLEVNSYGLTCSATVNCSSHCDKYLNPAHQETRAVLKVEGYGD